MQLPIMILAPALHESCQLDRTSPEPWFSAYIDCFGVTFGVHSSCWTIAAFHS